MSNNNIRRLGDTLSGRMKKTAVAAVKVTAELGVINSNMSLTTDSLKTPIPRGQYMVDIRLTGGTNTSAGYRGLRPSDRVLVVWCGNEPVICAVVASS